MIQIGYQSQNYSQVIWQYVPEINEKFEKFLTSVSTKSDRLFPFHVQKLWLPISKNYIEVTDIVQNLLKLASFSTCTN